MIQPCAAPHFSLRIFEPLCYTSHLLKFHHVPLTSLPPVYIILDTALFSIWPGQNPRVNIQTPLFVQINQNPNNTWHKKKKQPFTASLALKTPQLPACATGRLEAEPGDLQHFDLRRQPLPRLGEGREVVPGLRACRRRKSSGGGGFERVWRFGLFGTFFGLVYFIRVGGGGRLGLLGLCVVCWALEGCNGRLWRRVFFVSGDQIVIRGLKRFFHTNFSQLVVECRAHHLVMLQSSNKMWIVQKDSSRGV